MYWVAKISQCNLSQGLLYGFLSKYCKIETPRQLLSRGYILSRFQGENDRFNGVTVDTSVESCNHTEFEGKINDSLKHWSQEGKRCIWFKIKINDAKKVPILADKGFNFHHARDDFVMMYKWLPRDCGANLPPPAYTNLGVGAMVFNAAGQILAVSEKHYEYPHWKLPGGYVERGEHITAAAAREVREETGVRAECEALVTFRHTHHMMYGNADLYVLVRMRALTERIEAAPREVAAAQWMDVDAYLNHPHVHSWNRAVVRSALEHRARGLTLRLQRATVKWAQNTRDLTYLVVEQEQ